MRELKFRIVYDGILSNRMGYHDGFYVNKGILDIPQDDGPIFDQYIGLKDKNDKEIYEGDLLRFPEHFLMGKTFVVKFHEGMYGLFDKDGVHYRWLEKYTAEVSDKIGNVHENPELLES